ncbi:hypothetical protein HELRODRAFT_85113 [Helobdella robusta]|uniref:UDP-glucuronosyltransferase n=1 Tax=Helobdella robusta TaxID=6412 RepID=T1G5T0_HELRO|nr:hypothetical protein HELRODRAFT_85113 [Helobdella robusta]ESN97953.1 hypothetical protein HELRODRAFT_85113 [Helobdella robusta]
MNKKYFAFSVSFDAWLYGVPRLPSFVPSHRNKHTDRMNFGQRFQTFIGDCLDLLVNTLLKRPPFAEEFSIKDVEKENIFTISRKASYYLYLEDLTLGYPRPNMPNTMSVGDIVVGYPSYPLPYELDKFIGNSNAILVSFGSYVEYLNEETVKKFCSSFQRLENYKFIFKSKNKTLCGDHPKNLLTQPWIPQNDLLADSRIKLFVTHGGFNSMMESVYHAKPVVVFPLMNDQIGLASYAERHNYGVEMDFSNWEVDELRNNIIRVLNNKTFEESIKRSSDILRDRKTSAAERVSDAINHVVKYGDEHLKSGASDLYWFQFIMFDIFCVLLLTILISAVLVTFIVKYLFKKIFNIVKCSLKRKND